MMGRPKGSKPKPGSKKPGPKRPHSDLNMSLEEIAAELGCSRQNINAIELRALKKLRAGLEERGIDAELWFSHLADLNRMERTTSVVRIAPTRLARFERKVEEAESCGFATAE